MSGNCPAILHGTTSLEIVGKVVYKWTVVDVKSYARMRSDITSPTFEVSNGLKAGAVAKFHLGLKFDPSTGKPLSIRLKKESDGNVLAKLSLTDESRSRKPFEGVTDCHDFGRKDRIDLDLTYERGTRVKHLGQDMTLSLELVIVKSCNK